MSQRPRLAGDGRLLVPAKVAYDHRGFLRGRLSDRTVDPFDWTADRLLLAESFARLEPFDRPAGKRWFVQHGVVDRVDFAGRYAELPHDDWFVERRPEDLADHMHDIVAEQGNVLWHLTTLARLSERRVSTEWEADWGRLVIDSSDGDLVIGGPDAGAELKSWLFIDYLRRNPPEEPELQQLIREQTRLQEATEGWPEVSVGDIGWIGYWRNAAGAHGMGVPDEAKEKATTLGATWDQTLELERLLIAPYVDRAVERRFAIERETQDVGGSTRSVLVPREERIWQSILAPIYLQLFEALRRITEGEPGAATCRECGQPFLVLDARRRFFCNDRERFRFSQRQRRRRLAAEPTPEDPG